MSLATHEAAKALLSAWEKAAGEAAGRWMREPAVLDLGAQLLRGQMLWRRAALSTWQAMTSFAPERP